MVQNDLVSSCRCLYCARLFQFACLSKIRKLFQRNISALRARKFDSWSSNLDDDQYWDIHFAHCIWAHGSMRPPRTVRKRKNCEWCYGRRRRVVQLCAQAERYRTLGFSSVQSKFSLEKNDDQSCAHLGKCIPLSSLGVKSEVALSSIIELYRQLPSPTVSTGSILCTSCGACWR